MAGKHSTTEPTMLHVWLQLWKATDSKSVSLWERRFESYRLRKSTLFSPKVRFHGNGKVVERTRVYMSASLVQW